MEHIMTKEKKPIGFDFNRSFAADNDLEENGAWDEITMDGQTLEVKIARKNNPHYKKMLRSMMTRNKRKLERENEASVELFEKIIIDVMAHTILLGWNDLIVNGKNLEYSTTNAKLVLGNEDFRKEVDTLSEDFELFKESKDEDTRKN
jgi:hypothetical protein